MAFIKTITSVFFPEWSYSSASDPDIKVHVDWLEKHGCGKNVNSANVVRNISNNSQALDINAEIAREHRRRNLYCYLTLAVRSVPPITNCSHPDWDACDDIIFCGATRWAGLLPQMLEAGRQSYNGYLSRGVVPVIAGYYMFYIDAEFGFDTGMFFEDSWYRRKYKELYVGIINWVYQQMPNPGQNQMIISFSPWVRYYAKRIVNTYFKAWLEDLGDQVDIGSRYLKIFVMPQDGSGAFSDQKPGTANWSKLLETLQAIRNATTGTKYGSKFVYRINTELFEFYDGSKIRYADWSRVEAQINGEYQMSDDGLGACWCWYKYYYNFDDFVPYWHRYYESLYPKMQTLTIR